MAQIAYIAVADSHPHLWAQRPAPFLKAKNSRTYHYTTTNCASVARSNQFTLYVDAATLTADQICKTCRRKAQRDHIEYAVRAQFDGRGGELLAVFQGIDDLDGIADVNDLDTKALVASASVLERVKRLADIFADLADDDGIGQHLTESYGRLHNRFSSETATLHAHVSAYVQLVDVRKLAPLLSSAYRAVKAGGMDGYIVREAVKDASPADLVSNVARALTRGLRPDTDRVMLRERIAESAPFNLYADLLDPDSDVSVVGQLDRCVETVAARIASLAAEQIVTGLEPIVADMVNSPTAVAVVRTSAPNVDALKGVLHPLNPARVSMEKVDGRVFTYTLVGPRNVLEGCINTYASSSDAETFVVDTDDPDGVVATLRALATIDNFDAWVATAVTLADAA